MHNVNFYFNTGSLDANEIRRQFIDGMLSYKILGINILGIVSDGGGGNNNFFRSMTNNLLMLGPWPPQETIPFVNPVDITIKIYSWSCGTRLLKKVRNNIYRSQPKYHRNLKVDSVYFGWKDIEQIILETKQD